jgi:NarL family two-component system response regulator LiaR
VKIIIFTASRDKGLIMETLNLGVQGFQEKRADAKQIMSAIHAVHNGGTCMADCVTTTLIENMSTKSIQPQSSLSDRESQVLELIAIGKTNDDIANKLYISVRTVKFHITSIFNKLKVKNRTQAAAMWML